MSTQNQKLVHSCVQIIMEFFWPGVMENGLLREYLLLREYSLSGYHRQ